MGEHSVEGPTNPSELRAFTRAILDDFDALKSMVENGQIETGHTRFGAEQELFLVGADARAARASEAILAGANDERLTTELATYNLEANLPPGPIKDGFLTELRNELEDAIAVIRRSAHAIQVRPLLTGILPTLSGTDLELDSMAPRIRYRQLNANLLAQRGGEMQVFIRGIDEFHRTHHNVMLEAANASFQLHLQVSPADFAPLYNRAQLISAPLIAVAANSPLLLGRRLWHETRVPLFEAATDERSNAQRARGQRPRVGFGHRWIDESILEVFRADVARFPVLLTRELDQPASAVLREGGIPKLRALCLHNGTVWRWNRACYGATQDIAHVRIENRVLPSGPSIVDQVANAALFYGLMLAPEERFGPIPSRMTFDTARAAFVHAARYGLNAQLPWLDGRRWTVEELLQHQLLPAAREGLSAAGMSEPSIDRVLEPIQGRLAENQNGALWMLNAYTQLCARSSRESASRQLTESLLEHQETSAPVHTWPLPKQRHSPHRDLVRQRMHTIDTVQPEDALELAARVMDWSGQHFVAVESRDGEVHGVLIRTTVREHLQKPAQRPSPTNGAGARDNPASDNRARDFVTQVPLVPPTLDLEQTRELLATHPCLLIVSHGRLIGHVARVE